MKNIFYKPVIALFIGAMLLISSCSKKEGMHGSDPATSGTNQMNASMESKIRTIVANIPHVKEQNSSSMRKGVADKIQSGWDFSSPDHGMGYSTTSGFLYSSSLNTLVLSGGTGGGSAGGTVVAGASSMDMNYTFCYSSGDQILGLNVFGTGAPSTGVSAIIGVSGDFSKLASNSSTTDLLNAFNGMAFYIVYDGTASGSYDVVDWTDPSVHLDSIQDLNKKAFAFVMDFKNGRLFLSSSGQINVSGGSMSFNGQYFQVTGFLNSNGDFNLNGGNLTYSIVPGFGAMMCN